MSSSISRPPPRSAERSPTARPGRATVYRPARDLATVIGVDANTVLRALRALRDEGLLEFRRGRGTTVAGTPDQSAVLQRAQELVSYAREHRYATHELAQMIETLG